ncbi:MAG: hypothetical protein EON58_14325 [Alphaproteobacteria bacterium]|nr:MAG: hypothetical protein EON58_14325 [Alphaproteobacteria bacterium]
MSGPAPQPKLLIWESDIVQAGDGRAVVTAKKPVSHMSCKQAAKVLGCSEWTVSSLYRERLIEGFKPGARKQRKDGKASNAALRLDSESVLRYKAEIAAS